MDYRSTFEEIEKNLSELREENKKTPIIVEGEKDIIALRKLNITGEIISVNKGVSLIDFIDKIANEYKKIIILTDWDRKGGYICFKIKKNLEGRVDCDFTFRQFFARNSKVKTVEGLPSWINTLKEKIKE